MKLQPEEPARARPSAPPLNEYQQRHLYSGLSEIEKLLVEIEGIVAAAGSPSLFPRYVNDLTLSQRKLLEGGMARLRASLSTLLESQGLRPAPAPIQARGAICTTLIFAEIAAEELSPRNMRGYGELDAAQAREVEGVIAELRGRIGALLKELTPAPAEQLSARIAALPPSPVTRVLAALEHVTRERGMMEFRVGIGLAAARIAAPTMEIAIFGRVSCGKSSLLNFLLGDDLLPTGVTPVTAVPTRICFGATPGVVAQFEKSEATYPLSQLAELASEERNPDNRLGVTQLTVAHPSPKLRHGVVFVDTPGLGSIRSWGAMQTLAYLPRSDMAILLIDVGSTLGADELELVRWLHQGGMPVQVLLSKADLASSADLDASLRFTSAALAREVSDGIPVRAVSTRNLDMAEAWFRDEILPLYGALQARFQASIGRRVGALRDSVLSALKMATPGAGPSVNADATAELARQLRVAEAEDERVEAAFRDLPSSMESAVASTMAAMAADLQVAWRTSPHLQGDALRRVAGEALGRAMVANSQEALTALEKLGRTYSSTLDLARRTLPGIDTALDPDSFTPRNLPMPEIGTVPWEIRLPRLGVLGSAHIVRQFQRQLEPHRQHLADALRHYGSTVQRSASAELASMRRLFQSRADIYRAALQRLGGALRDEAPPGEDLAASLQLIADWIPPETPHQPLRTGNS